MKHLDPVTDRSKNDVSRRLDIEPLARVLLRKPAFWFGGIAPRFESGWTRRTGLVPGLTILVLAAGRRLSPPNQL